MATDITSCVITNTMNGTRSLKWTHPPQDKQEKLSDKNPKIKRGFLEQGWRVDDIQCKFILLVLNLSAANIFFIQCEKLIEACSCAQLPSSASSQLILSISISIDTELVLFPPDTNPARTDDLSED